MSIVHDIDFIFSPDGPLAGLPNFEHRSQQSAMAKAVALTLESDKKLIIEAPTGVGKSLAYLFPAILFALKNKRKAIISTHTKNLQEQLLRKDLDIVRSVIDAEFHAAMFKGRNNYLCTTRLRHALHNQRSLFEKDQTDELKKLTAWSEKTEEGDLDSLPFRVQPELWNLVCSEQHICGPAHGCGTACFYQRARNRVRQAHIVVINHALFFTLLSVQQSESHFLFPDDFVIFDEAHTLEGVAGATCGMSISRGQVLFALRRLYNPETKKGLLGRLKSRELQVLCEEAQYAATSFFDDVRSATNALKSHGNTIRIRQPFFTTNTVEFPLQSLIRELVKIENNKEIEIDKDELRSSIRLVQEADASIKSFLRQEDEGMTYWIELGGGRSQNVFLRAAPTDVSDVLSHQVFQRKIPVVLTSATLSVNGSLGYIQERLGAESASTLVLDSPFDFRRQMKLYVARDIASPESDEFRGELPEWIFQSIKRSQGRALVLFTSGSLMRAMAGALEVRLAADGIRMLVQSAASSRHQLLEDFKDDIGSVLFGLDSFWMGVDVPGEALEHVIITRLPFAVPDHPLTEARIEQIVNRGGNSFAQYSLLEAVLKLRQGVGRLIRSTSDKGIVTILDSRLLTKRYGRVFLRSLPRCSVEILSADGSAVPSEIFEDAEG